MPPRNRRIAAVPSGSGRKASGLAGKVAETIEALSLTASDAAAGELALRYAAVLDLASADEVALSEQVKAMGEIGPKLLAVLVALGGTPKARGKDPQPSQGPSRLAALRAGGDPA
jgi:hypothetical protein